jgi:hypothetical protein
MAIRIGNTGTVRINGGVKVLVAPGDTGQKWYVSSTFTGTSDGSINAPWKTLSTVSTNFRNKTIKPGDTVFFKRGEQFLTTDVLTLTASSGLSTRPITFSAYGSGDKPIITGPGSRKDHIIVVRDCSYLVFDNLNFTDPTMDPTDRSIEANYVTGIRLEISRSSHQEGVVVKNCDFSLIGIGVTIQEGTRYNTVDNCVFTNLRLARNTPTTVNPDDDYGANAINIQSYNNVVTNCLASGCFAPSYDYGWDGGGVEFFSSGDPVENNFVAYNTFYDNNGSFEHGGGGSAPRQPIRNNVFAYNKIINCGSLFYINNGGTFAIEASNLQFYNNVIIQTANKRDQRDATPGSIMSSRVKSTIAGTVVLKNNIFFSINGSVRVARPDRFDETNMTISNNVFTLQNGSTMNFPTSSTDIFSTGSYTPYWVDTTDPNPLNWNLNPLANSILINSGVDVGQTRDFAGNPVSNPPERGIFEYV